MSEYVLVLFNQKLVEIRIGTYNCDINKRTRERHLVDVRTKFDIAAEKILISEVKLRLWTKRT